MRILDLRRPGSPTALQMDPQRKGTFTSNLLAYVEDHPVALYFTGWQHAGENLAAVLRQRGTELDPPIQMCDALSRNQSPEFGVVAKLAEVGGRLGARRPLLLLTFRRDPFGIGRDGRDHFLADKIYGGFGHIGRVLRRLDGDDRRGIDRALLGMNPTIVRINRPTRSPSIQSPFVAPEGFRSILPRKAPTQIFAR